jgi:hypothetical protein
MAHGRGRRSQGKAASRVDRQVVLWIACCDNGCQMEELGPQRTQAGPLCMSVLADAKGFGSEGWVGWP